MAVYTTIDNPELYFQVKLYTGNAGTQSITLDGSEDMQPDLIWIKCRGAIELHTVVDSVRGDSTENSGYKYIETQSDGAEQAHSGNTLVDAITSDGFNIGNNNQVNIAQPFVAWCWKESATAGFDIVSYTGNSTNRTISHSLSAVPHWIIAKKRSASDGWAVYHKGNTSAPETDHLRLDTSDATVDDDNEWNDTVGTSSVFTIGTGGRVNDNTATYIAYLWSEKQGFSKFGSYTGNGNANGTFVYTGFRPAFLITKRTDSADAWFLIDAARNAYNVTNLALRPDHNSTETTTNALAADFTATGFKLRGTDGSFNASGGTYVYIAFAEAPFVNSNGVPCNAR